MSYEIPKDHVDLGAGQWADIYTDVLHRTKRLVQEIAQPFFNMGGGKATLKVGQDGTMSTDIEGDVEVDMTKLPLTQITDVMIVGQVAAWSFADQVDHETLGMLPESFHEKLRGEVNARFADPLVVSSVRGSESQPLPRSNGGHRFRWPSRKR